MTIQTFLKLVCTFSCFSSSEEMEFLMEKKDILEERLDVMVRQRDKMKYVVILNCVHIWFKFSNKMHLDLWALINTSCTNKTWSGLQHDYEFFNFAMTKNAATNVDTTNVSNTYIHNSTKRW